MQDLPSGKSIPLVPVRLLDCSARPHGYVQSHPDNESRVQAAFSRLSEGKTVIMIAHRLSTVTNVDQIFVICNGQVAECGNSRELLAKDGIFSRMWKNYQTSVQWKVTKEVQ